MSTVVSTELQEFAQFIQAKLTAGETKLSPEEVLDQWRDAHPSEEEFEENVQAIQEALDQMNAGEKGVTAAESVQRLRERIGISTK
jgi:hypothetical protein